MNPSARRSLHNSFPILYRRGLAPARAVERIREEVPATEPIRVLLDFVARASRHGIVKGTLMSAEDWGDEASPRLPPAPRHREITGWWPTGRRCASASSAPATWASTTCSCT